MISPSEEHIAISKRTLRFGQISATVKQSVRQNLFNLPSVKLKQSSEVNITEISVNQTCDEKKSDMNEQQLEYTLRQVKVKGGYVGVHEFSSKALPHSPNIAVVLHAHSAGCSGLDWDYLFQPLLSAGYLVIAPDFPGFGESADLPRLSSRTEDHSVTNGALDILNTVLDSYMISQRKKKVILLGYDWGGGIALCFAHKYPKLVLKVAVFHPSWTQSYLTLNQIRAEVLILWVPVEQLHPISQGTKMARALPNCKFVKVSIGPYSNAKAAGYYHSIGDKIVSQIIAFIPKVKAKKNEAKFVGSVKVSVSKEKTKAIKSGNDSNNNSSINNSRGNEDYLLQQMDAGVHLFNVNQQLKDKLPESDLDLPIFTEDNPMSNKKLDIEKWAVQRMKEVLKLGLSDEYYKAYISGSPMKPTVVKLFGSLPVLNPESVTMSEMVEWGIWEVAPGFEMIASFPRYLPGRQVLIKTTVHNSYFPKADDFLTFDLDTGEEFVTHRAIIAAVHNDHFDVYVDAESTSSKKFHRISIPKSMVFEYNQPTNFKRESEGYLFEDKVHCKYSDLITRAKMIEAALSINPFVKQMRFDQIENEKYVVGDTPNARRLLALQKKSICTIRRVFDLIHFDNDGFHRDRISHSSVGRVSINGQGNCHTMASVMAAYLLPFSHLLGWEIRFRAGFFYKANGRDHHSSFDGKPRNIADHTWLEVTLIPSLRSYVCDPSFHQLVIPLDHAYSMEGCRHPSIARQCNSGPVKYPMIVSDNRSVVPVKRSSWPQDTEFFGRRPTPINWQKLFAPASPLN